MDIAAIAYLSQLQALLPQGAAWPRDPDAVQTRVLDALAQEFARIDKRAGDLIREADPRTTIELIEEWERVCSLPEECLDLADTVQERRRDVHAKLVATGGQSRQYFIDIAAALGVEVQITEFLPFRAGYSAAGEPVASDDAWRHTWQVDAPETIITMFSAGQSAAGQPVRSWGNERLECAITKRKPAHTELLFAYYL